MCHVNRLPKLAYNEFAASLFQFGDPRPVAGESPRVPLSALEYLHLCNGDLPAETCGAFQFHVEN